MMPPKSLRAALAASLLPLSFCIAVAANAQGTPSKLKVGVEGNYPPFSQLSPDGKLSGFDIDIANAVCAEMKAECTLVQQEWDGMIPALNVKKFDMIVASMTITEERRKAVEFSDPYYDVPSRFVAKSGAFTDASPAALKGKKIAVLRNSPRATYLQERYKDSEVLLVAKEPEVYMELGNGRADVGFGSSVVSGEAFLKKPEGKGYGQLGPVVRIAGGSGVGIAIRKSDNELREQINVALKAVKTKGIYKQLAAKYFDFDVSGDSQ